jgi:hypothetical protein
VDAVKVVKVFVQVPPTVTPTPTIDPPTPIPPPVPGGPVGGGAHELWMRASSSSIRHRSQVLLR